MSRSGFVLGKLVVGTMNLPVDAPRGLAVPVRTWANGLMHRGLAFSLKPWRHGSRRRFAAPRPAVVIAWRL